MFGPYCAGIMSEVSCNSGKSGFCGFLSGLGGSLLRIANFYLGRNVGGGTGGQSIPLLDRIAKHSVGRVILVAANIMLCAVALFLSIEASPLFVSRWFFGLFILAMAAIPPLIASFSDEETNVSSDEETSVDIVEETSAFFNEKINVAPMEAQNAFLNKEPNMVPLEETKEEIQNDFETLQKWVMDTNIKPSTILTAEDLNLIKLIVDRINEESDNFIDFSRIKTYGDLQDIAGSIVNGSMFMSLLLKTGQDDNSLGLKVDNLQASVCRLVRLAAHFGNFDNQMTIAIMCDGGGYDFWICPAMPGYNDEDLQSNFRGITYCVCTGSSEIVEKIRSICAIEDVCPNAIFVGNTYDSNGDGTIRIWGKANGWPAKETKRWKAKGKINNDLRNH